MRLITANLSALFASLVSQAAAAKMADSGGATGCCYFSSSCNLLGSRLNKWLARSGCSSFAVELSRKKTMRA